MQTIRIDLSPERISAVARETGATLSVPANVAVIMNDKGRMLIVDVGEFQDDAELEHAIERFDPDHKESGRVLPFPAAWPKTAPPLISLEALPPEHPKHPKHSDADVPELGPKDMMLCWILRPNTICLDLIESAVSWIVLRVLGSSSRWSLELRPRLEIHWPDFDRLPAHARDVFVRLLWNTCGRRVVINGLPARVTRRRTLRDLPPEARKELLIRGGAAVVGVGVLLWRASPLQAGVGAGLLLLWAVWSWIEWVRG